MYLGAGGGGGEGGGGVVGGQGMEGDRVRLGGGGGRGGGRRSSDRYGSSSSWEGDGGQVAIWQQQFPPTYLAILLAMVWSHRAMVWGLRAMAWGPRAMDWWVLGLWYGGSYGYGLGLVYGTRSRIPPGCETVQPGQIQICNM